MTDTEWNAFLAKSKRAAERKFAASAPHSKRQRQVWRKIHRDIEAGKRPPLERDHTWRRSGDHQRHRARKTL